MVSSTNAAEDGIFEQSFSGEQDDLLARIAKLCKVSSRVNAARHTTMAIGGPLSYLIELDSEEQAMAVIAMLASNQQRFKVLGAGSNLLIPDHGLKEWVIKAGRGFRYVKSLGQHCFEVGASMPLMTLSSQLCQQSYSGLEFAGGIPASMGGALFMNAGAHGGQIADVVKEVHLIDCFGSKLVLQANELSFSYRSTSLPGISFVSKVVIELVPSQIKRVMEERARCLAQRKAAQPLSLPSAGSVFKNPSPKMSAGQLLRQAGLAGTKIGGAQISDMHANWIVNPSRLATSNDVKALIALAQVEVKRQFSINLEPEVIAW